MDMLIDHPLVIPVTLKTLSIANTQKVHASISKQSQFDGFSIIRQSLQDRQIPERAADVIMASWKPSTHKQYAVYIRRWFRFSCEKQISTIQVTVNYVVLIL